MAKRTESEIPSEALDIDNLAEQAKADYRRLVDEQARGLRIDADELRQVLIVAGKGLATFKADVDRLFDRYAAAEDLARADAMQSEITAATEDLAAIEAEDAAETARHRKVVTDIGERFSSARAKMESLAGDQARLRNAASEALQKTADPAIAAETRRLQSEMRQATQDAIVRHHPEPKPLVEDKNASPQKQALAEREFAWAERQHAVGEAAENRRGAAAEQMRTVKARALEPLAGMSWAP